MRSNTKTRCILAATVERAEAATAEAEVAAVVEGLVRGVAIDAAASDDARGAAG